MKKRLILTCVICLIALAMIIVGAILLTNRAQTPNDPTASQKASEPTSGQTDTYDTENPSDPTASNKPYGIFLRAVGVIF